MVINFKVCGISRGTRKLSRTPTLIKKIYYNPKWCSSTSQALNLLLRCHPVRVSQTSRALEAYKVINFKTRKISQDADKLTQKPTLIKKFIKK
jgi:hypothetical protein